MSNKGRVYHTDDFYADRGCSLHPRCLKCPEPECKYDMIQKRAYVERRRERQRQEILLLRQQGAAIGEIAERLGISRRQIFRRLETT